MDFIKANWKKILLVLVLTVITYASVSQTFLMLNKRTKAENLCTGAKEIAINDERKLADTINSYLSTNRPTSKFLEISDIGMVMIKASKSQSPYINPLILLGIAEKETQLATSTSSPSMAGGNFFGRKARTGERYFCTNFSEVCDTNSRWYVFPGVGESMIQDEADYVRNEYVKKNIDYPLSGLNTTVMTAIVSQAGSAVACSTGTSTTVSPPTTSSSTPSCTFNPTTYSTTSGTSVSLKYGTVNAVSAQICSAGGTCATANVGSGQSFSANPTSSTTYTLTVKNASGVSNNCKATVSVASATTTTVATPSCAFNPTSYTSLPGVVLGLKYSTSNATSAEICSSGGTCKATNIGSSQTFNATPVSSTTYTITVKNAAGTTKACTANVTIPSPSCAFSPNTYSTTSGTPVNLTYTTNGATSVKVCSSSGSCKTGLPAGVSQIWTANPTASTTYTMTVTNASNVTATCTATMSVN